MEIVGGFMMMMSIIGLFLAVIWLIMPFVVLAIKGKQDRTLEVLELMEKRLEAIDTRLQRLETGVMRVAEPVAGAADVVVTVSESETKIPVE